MRKFLLGFIIAGFLFMAVMTLYVNYVDAEPLKLEAIQSWETTQNGEVVAQVLIDGTLYEYVFMVYRQYGAPTDCREHRVDSLTRYFSTRRAIYQVSKEPREVRVCVSYDFIKLKCKKWKIVTLH